MNYSKYIPEWQEIEAIIHQHWLTVMDSFILWMSFGALIPSFLYYNSERLRDLVPFSVIELLLFLVFLKIVYELFNWYNDVWVITNDAVYDIEWSLLKTKVESIHHENIEGVEIDKHRIWDNIFNKWDIIIHKFWEEELAIYNAYAPYKAANILEQYVHWSTEDDQEQDRFDMIMDALSGVVSEHLKTHGVDGASHEKHSKKLIEPDEYSIDLRE
jgi:hypothetical protein